MKSPPFIQHNIYDKLYERECKGKIENLQILNNWDSGVGVFWMGNQGI